MMYQCKDVKYQAKSGYIVRPEKNNVLGGDHPLNLIEIVSDVSLRKENNLKDGDKVKIKI